MEEAGAFETYNSKLFFCPEHEGNRFLRNEEEVTLLP
jgi:hypothetical protein